MDEEEFMNFLKASLPPYIVQCFIVSGYDSARVVAQMTTNGLDNSIDQMENFILKEYSDDPSCYHMSKIKSTYVFASGHRIKITNFINDVKAYKVPVKRKLSSNPTTNKKCRSHASSSSVLCTFCSREYKLHSKDNTTDNDTRDSRLNFMISNWTGHVKKCFNARSCKRAKQQTISKFLPSSDDKSINTNKESSQTPAHQFLSSKTVTMSDSSSTPPKHATVVQFASKDVKLQNSPRGHVTHVDTPSPSSANSNPPNDDKNKSPCGHVTYVDTSSPSSVTSNPPPNDDKNAATDLTSIDESNQCFQQTSPVRVIQERL